MDTIPMSVEAPFLGREGYPTSPTSPNSATSSSREGLFSWNNHGKSVDGKKKAPRPARPIMPFFFNRRSKDDGPPSLPLAALPLHAAPHSELPSCTVFLTQCPPSLSSLPPLFRSLSLIPPTALIPSPSSLPPPSIPLPMKKGVISPPLLPTPNPNPPSPPLTRSPSQRCVSS